MVDIVSQNAVSYDVIKSDLNNYVKSLNDYNLRWKDFYEGGPGVILTELIASVATYLNLVALKSRREAYIDEARLTSSIYGISTTLGYDVNRATSPSYSINVTCVNPIAQKKEVPIGTYSSVPISLVQDSVIPVGSSSLTVILGSWRNYTVTSPTSATYTRFLIEDTVDNNLYTLFINGQEVETIRSAELLTSDNVLLRSYFSGLYIIFGDGIFGRQLNIGDVVSFDYFVPAPISQDTSFNTSVTYCNIGTINSGNVITYGSNQDSNTKLAIVAPGFYTTKRRLVTYSDYKYVAMSYNGVISSGVQKHPGICCTVDLAIIGDGGRSFSSNEQTSFLQYMDGFQVLGTSINLVPATPINVSVKLLVVINTTADQGAITTIIRNYLNSMTLNLGEFFSISGLLNLNLPNVIGVYPQYPITDNQAAYNQYFLLEGLSIEFTTSFGTINSFGTNSSLGYT